MTKNKEQYCSPNTKVLVVRFEGCILQGSPYGAKNQAGAEIKEDLDYTYNY